MAVLQQEYVAALFVSHVKSFQKHISVHCLAAMRKSVTAKQKTNTAQLGQINPFAGLSLQCYCIHPQPTYSLPVFL